MLMAICVLLMAGCANGDGFRHAEQNGAYYWKTTIKKDPKLAAFVGRHDVRRIYLHVYDVVVDTMMSYLDGGVVPNATLRFEDGQLMDDICDDTLVTYVPTVYITLEAMKKMKAGEGEWARKLVTRTMNMCSYNGIKRVEGMQLDCDWTPSTRQSFFALCDNVRGLLAGRAPKATLSCTIRLHQLAMAPPPVDYGVLMVYNTGAFDNPDARNSIIHIDDVRPYLKRIAGYALHLDVAYPVYEWQLLFRQRRFAGLLREANLADTACFKQMKPNLYRVRKRTYLGDKALEEDDIIRLETSDPSAVAQVKDLVEAALKGKPHSNILYHLDSDNLKKYTDDEIDELYRTGI